MPRRSERDLAEQLPDLGGALDRAAEWVGDNPVPFLVAVALILVVTGAVGVSHWWTERRELGASEAVAQVQADYLRAMGAPPGSTHFAEPATPETARQARETYAARFAEAAEAHPGTAAAVDAWLEAGNLRSELGQEDPAIEAWKKAVAEAPAGSPLRGLALERLAVGYESKGAWGDAGSAHEEAGEIASFPLRHFAMADAARCFAAAGDVEHARALADRVLKEAEANELPDFLRSRLEEIRAQ